MRFNLSCTQIPGGHSTCLPLLIVCLLAAQILALQHNHADDLDHRAECHLCLKQESSHEDLIAALALPVHVRAEVSVTVSLDGSLYRTPPALKSRSPPRDSLPVTS